MIIFDKLLTVNRLKNAMAQLTETMGSYNTYSKSIALARKMAELFENSDNVRQALFGFDDMRTMKAYRYLEGIGRKDIADFIRYEIPNYTSEDLSLFKVLVNSEVYRIKPENVENIAFAGGGAKGIAYPGVLREIAEKNMKIQKVSGTSAGAITALPFALGYTPKKIEEIVLQYDFTRFMYESNINHFLLKNTVMTEMMYQSSYLAEFKKQFDSKFLDYLINNPHFFAKLGIPYEKVKDVTDKHQENLLIEHHYNEVFLKLPDLKSKLRFLPMDDYLKDVIKNSKKAALDIYVRSLDLEKDKEFAAELLKDMNSRQNNRYGDLLVEFIRLKREEDLIEEFFGDLIEKRLYHFDKSLLESISEGLSTPDRLRNITFKEFEEVRKLATGNTWNFKDLAICICEKVSDNPLKLFDKDNYKQIDVYAGNPDTTYSEMPIKTAVRISMNLPGAFSSYEYKGKKYVDGGVRANFPMHFFDNTLGFDRRKTIGFCLAPSENYSRTEDAGKVLNPDRKPVISQNGLLKRAIIHVSNYVSDVITQIHGNKLDNNKPLDFLDLTRIGVINVLKIDTTAFNLSQRTKIDLFKQGYYTAHDMLKDNYNAQLRHFVERMKILHSKIETDLTLLKSISNKKHEEILKDFSNDGHDLQEIGQYVKSLQDDVKYNLGEKINRKSFKPQ